MIRKGGLCDIQRETCPHVMTCHPELRDLVCGDCPDKKQRIERHAEMLPVIAFAQQLATLSKAGFAIDGDCEWLLAMATGVVLEVEQDERDLMRVSMMGLGG